MENRAEPFEWGKCLSAIFLVAGTSTGGGMLALPVATGISGFVPSTLMMVLCWLAMTASALFLLEVNLWMKEGAHIITMADTLLGPVGKGIAWCLYLFICYASLVAYTSAGGALVVNAFEYSLGITLPEVWACFLFILIFGGITSLGSYFVGRVNAILFVAMVAAYLALVGTGVFEVKSSLLKQMHWSTSFLAIPLLLTTFSFQTMLPSLTPYLKRNVKALRIAIIVGTTITLLVYVIWEWMVLGIVPVNGPNSLLKALEVGEPITQFLREHVESYWLAAAAEYFAFFALVTSFLGIALGLFDFLSDGLKVHKLGIGKFVLSLLVLVPTFFFAIYFERIFLMALDISGGFGDALLNGIMPVVMVWVGRYVWNFPEENRTPGGKWLLVSVFGFFLIAVTLEIAIHAGWICSIFDACVEYSKQQGSGL